MISLIFDKDVFKLLTIFSISPGSRFKRNELKEKTKLNNMPLDNTLLKLVNSNFIKKEKKLYFLNLTLPRSVDIITFIYKQYESLKQIPLDIYFLLIDLIYNIKLSGEEVYLFGSYSKLVYKEGSDIDIAILGRDFNKNSINNIISKFENKYNKKIEIHIFDKIDFYKNKKDPLIKDIIRNGVRLI